MADLRKAIRFDKCDCQVSILGGVKSPGIRVEQLEKGVKHEKQDTGKEGEGREGKGEEREGGSGSEIGGGGGEGVGVRNVVNFSEYSNVTSDHMQLPWSGHFNQSLPLILSAL